MGGLAPFADLIQEGVQDLANLQANIGLSGGIGAQDSGGAGLTSGNKGDI